MEKKRDKILLVQLYSNGDCLYATTVAQQIKKDFPGCHLTWAIASFCKDIIKLNPFVDDVRIVNNVSKNNITAFRKFKQEVLIEKKRGDWNEVFITSNIDDNQALYDGTIRGMILRAYPGKITVPIQPVLVLDDNEKKKVADFATLHNLSKFKNVILWEYAPQSGQNTLNFDVVKRIASKLVSEQNTCVILSAANAFESTKNIFDASVLTIRENAALSHYCTLLIGASSGITWLCTSSAGKFLPMIQLLNPNAYFFNAPSVDFKRYDLSDDNLIELIEFDERKIYECASSAVNKGFKTTKDLYNQNIPLQFKTTSKIIYNLLCYMQFNAIFKHLKVVYSVYGLKIAFLKQFILGIISFPFKLGYNFFNKRVLKTKAIKI